MEGGRGKENASDRRKKSGYLDGHGPLSHAKTSGRTRYSQLCTRRLCGITLSLQKQPSPT